MNLTYSKWPDAANFELYVAASGSEHIDRGTDPVYPNRRNHFDKFGGEHLAKCGWLKDNLVGAMCDADALFARIRLKEWKEEHAKEVEEKKRLRRQKFNSLKKKVMSLFSLKFLEK